MSCSMANEYGKAAVMVLYGVEILNQGSQFSMDNIQSQMACTFVASRLKCLEAVDMTTGKTIPNNGKSSIDMDEYTTGQN